MFPNVSKELLLYPSCRRKFITNIRREYLDYDCTTDYITLGPGLLQINSSSAPLFLTRSTTSMIMEDFFPIWNIRLWVKRINPHFQLHGFASKSTRKRRNQIQLMEILRAKLRMNESIRKTWKIQVLLNYKVQSWNEN